MRNLFWGTFVAVLLASCELPVIAKMNNPKDANAAAYAGGSDANKVLFVEIAFVNGSLIQSVRMDPLLGTLSTPSGPNTNAKAGNSTPVVSFAPGGHTAILWDGSATPTAQPEGYSISTSTGLLTDLGEVHQTNLAGSQKPAFDASGSAAFFTSTSLFAYHLATPSSWTAGVVTSPPQSTFVGVGSNAVKPVIYGVGDNGANANAWVYDYSVSTSAAMSAVGAGQDSGLSLSGLAIAAMGTDSTGSVAYLLSTSGRVVTMKVGSNGGLTSSTQILLQDSNGTPQDYTFGSIPTPVLSAPGGGYLYFFPNKASSLANQYNVLVSKVNSDGSLGARVENFLYTADGTPNQLPVSVRLNKAGTRLAFAFLGTRWTVFTNTVSATGVFTPASAGLVPGASDPYVLQGTPVIDPSGQFLVCWATDTGLTAAYLQTFDVVTRARVGSVARPDISMSPFPTSWPTLHIAEVMP